MLDEESSEKCVSDGNSGISMAGVLPTINVCGNRSLGQHQDNTGIPQVWICMRRVWAETKGNA